MKEKNVIISIIILVMLGLIITAGVQFTKITGPDYEFNKEVHGYFENAYYANNPELMTLLMAFKSDLSVDILKRGIFI